MRTRSMEFWKGQTPKAAASQSTRPMSESGYQCRISNVRGCGNQFPSAHKGAHLILRFVPKTREVGITSHSAV
jgi:hypothetical protein